MSNGKVYIASKKMRGPWAPRPEGVVILDVTSAQSKTSNRRRDFSPMSPIEGGYKGFYCFENYWQSGKLIEGVDRGKHISWWKKQTKGKRRYPKSRGKRVFCALFGDGVPLDYVESRKKIYVPEYYELMHGTESFLEFKTLVESGNDVVVYDFDGPRSIDGKNECHEISLDLLKKKICETHCPFGQGYVVAAGLLGITPDQYC